MALIAQMRVEGVSVLTDDGQASPLAAAELRKVVDGRIEQINARGRSITYRAEVHGSGSVTVLAEGDVSPELRAQARRTLDRLRPAVTREQDEGFVYDSVFIG